MNDRLKEFSQTFEWSILNDIFEEFGDDGVITDGTIEALAVGVANAIRHYDNMFNNRLNFKDMFIRQFNEAYEHPDKDTAFDDLCFNE